MCIQSSSETKTSERVLDHFRNYPALQIRDIFKYLFQSAFGCEHLVSSPEAAASYINEEYAKGDFPKDAPQSYDAAYGV